MPNRERNWEQGADSGIIKRGACYLKPFLHYAFVACVLEVNARDCIGESSIFFVWHDDGTLRNKVK